MFFCHFHFSLLTIDFFKKDIQSIEGKLTLTATAVAMETTYKQTNQQTRKKACVTLLLTLNFTLNFFKKEKYKLALTLERSKRLRHVRRVVSVSF